MAMLRVVGFDPSLNNWGIASGLLDTETLDLTITNLGLIQPVLPKGKQVRQNSKDLEAAQQLATGALEAAKDAQAIFVEVPIGSQSARAMASYGICCGVLGALRALDKPFFELTPTEVKVGTVGKKTATKSEMIAWATDAFPNAPWPTYQRNGQTLVTETKAEHMADAAATVMTGINSSMFRMFLQLAA